jgi:hypothetical protein
MAWTHDIRQNRARPAACASAWVLRDHEAVHEPGEALRVRTRSPEGREVDVVAVPRGRTLRRVAQNHSDNPIADLIGLILITGGSRLISRFRSGWKVGIVSVDSEPWLGQWVLHREYLDEHPVARLTALASQVESGEPVVAQPRDWRFRETR